jgi:NAD(P)-dependent dehydrogenase (short-subunit alcohol dehydrogenase family)
MAIDDILVITGGAGGMGLACARALANRGRLLLVDLREDLLDQARKALGAQGPVVETLRCDVTSPADVTAVADRVHELGRPLPGRPEDIAATVAFLESDAAAFISGCDIRVDGGLVGAGKHLMGVG